jgi:hypothetical protein
MDDFDVEAFNKRFSDTYDLMNRRSPEMFLVNDGDTMDKKTYTMYRMQEEREKQERLEREREEQERYRELQERVKREKLSKEKLAERKKLAESISRYAPSEKNVSLPKIDEEKPAESISRYAPSESISRYAPSEKKKVSLRELLERRRNTRLYGDIFDVIAKSENI